MHGIADPKRVAEANGLLLLGIASDRLLFAEWLRTLACHINRSILNCAAIQAAGLMYEPELRSAREWRALGGSIESDAKGVDIVLSRKGRFSVCTVYPASVVSGASARRELPLASCDPSRPDHLCVLESASEHNGLSNSSANVRYSVLSRYGVLGSVDDIEMPDCDIAASLSALKDFCNEIRLEARDVIVRMDAEISLALSPLARGEKDRNEISTEAVPDSHISNTRMRESDPVARAGLATRAAIAASDRIGGKDPGVTACKKEEG